MIINIFPGQFGGPMRAGDLVALCNVVEYLRVMENNPEIKFHLMEDSVSKSLNVTETYKFIENKTDYFSEYVGIKKLPWRILFLIRAMFHLTHLCFLRRAYIIK